MSGQQGTAARFRMAPSLPHCLHIDDVPSHPGGHGVIMVMEVMVMTMVVVTRASLQ